MSTKKKRLVRNKRKKNIALLFFLFLFVIIGIGYSTLGTNLSVSGHIDVSEYYRPTLYNVLKDAAQVGTYAKEYTGSHQDSFTVTPKKKIYYWYASSSNNASTILERNNVIFAGHCWQMIRTTDTGGVKLLYNGEVNNNQCLTSRNSHVGYSGVNTYYLTYNYYYGTDYTYDTSNNVFRLSGTISQKTWNEANAPSIIGKYSCLSTSSNDTCSELIYVYSYKNESQANVLTINSNAHYATYGNLKYNLEATSLSQSGYMYNALYPAQSYNFSHTENVLIRWTLQSGWLYADSYTYGMYNPQNYYLNNPYTVSNFADGIGKYTLGMNHNTSSSGISLSIEYLTAVDGSNGYLISLSGGESLSSVNYSLTYGESYTDNGNGTYTINNPSTFSRTDYYNNYTNIKNKYVCKNATNNTCSEIWYITNSSNTTFYYYSSAENFKYASGFTYNTSTGNYTLNNDSVTFWLTNDTNNINSLNNAHYTCHNLSGVCSTISYIYNNPYYIDLTNGENIDDAINKMLSDDNVNVNNSLIKTIVDMWYQKYMLSYDSYLEDTIYCNDRSIQNRIGWNPNGGSVTGNQSLTFHNYDTSVTDLSCTNETDQFSVSNSKAQLSYKVGLFTAPEMRLLSQNSMRYVGNSYWLLSPSYYRSNYSYGSTVNTNGEVVSTSTTSTAGIRPAITLKPDMEFSSGNGSRSNPYIVKLD